jgi:hypothetical protein
MHTHAFHKHRCWCRGGMNPYGPTPSRVKSALSANIMRSRKKEFPAECRGRHRQNVVLPRSSGRQRRFTRSRWQGDMTCRRKTCRQTVDWVMYFVGAVLCMLIPRWSATSRHLSDRLDAQTKQQCTSGGILSESQLPAWDELGLLETVLQCG